ncbi:hypothetical protein [Gracilibacillus xinjiangensis]|uniref:Type II secretion system protein n=1 Tax=Gracilibacillus xinjiangensis TaxID=1193282 RepID=A0ABV8WXP8_9BACI
MVRGGVTLKNNNEAGYFLFEVMIGTFILLSVLLSILPLVQQLKIENHKLLERTIVTHKLYDSLLLLNESSPADITYTDWINTNVVVTIRPVPPYWKGCANWDNVKSDSEQVCLYSYQK